MTEYLRDNELFEPFQSGFRAKHSTCTASLKFTSDIKLAMDKRFVTVAVFFNFSKAFPSVDHSRLLHKLESFNMSGSVCKWFGSYLDSRFQKIMDERGEFSDWDRLECGVPQGAALSALLFNIFITELGEKLQYCKFHKYAK